MLGHDGPLVAADFGDYLVHDGCGLVNGGTGVAFQNNHAAAKSRSRVAAVILLAIPILVRVYSNSSPTYGFFRRVTVGKPLMRSVVQP